MTYLPAKVMGRWFYLYLILDLYSRKIVGAEVHESDDADHAVHLVRRTALAERIATLQAKPVLHGDNGSTLKATTVLAMLQWLGVKPSYSRPRVSDDNAYAESLFRTAKYRPEFPATGFADLEEARAWAAEFARWYNVDHRHSGIRYVSPQQRHTGDDQTILAARHELYSQAQKRNPARWSGKTRDWSHIGAVTLNPGLSEFLCVRLLGDFSAERREPPGEGKSIPDFHPTLLVNRSPYAMANWFIASRHSRTERP
jgi:transposase InsO family protein